MLISVICLDEIKRRKLEVDVSFVLLMEMWIAQLNTLAKQQKIEALDIVIDTMTKQLRHFQSQLDNEDC